MKISKIITSICSSILLLIFYSCAGSSNPHSWGNIPAEYAHRKVFPTDTTTNASVVFDIGSMVTYLNQGVINLTRHVRIQIYKEGGKEYTNIRIPFGKNDKVRAIKAQTILPNGKKIKLSKKDIFEEGLKDGWRYKIFAIPGVTKHCIVEYKYTLQSKNIFILNPWYFQSEIPTEYSRISFMTPLEFKYELYLTNPPLEDYQPEGSYSTGGERKYKFTYEFRDLPPIPDEPFMTAPQDYMTRLNFELKEIQTSFYSRQFVSSWNDLKENMEIAFNPFTKGTDKYLHNLSDQLLDNEMQFMDKVEKLYYFVRDSIDTDKGYFSLNIGTPKDMVKWRKGSAAEKNLLLIGLLNVQHINAYPVLISTRDYGRFSHKYPRINAFNHVITLIKRNGQSFLLDPSDPYCPIDILPHNDYSFYGLWLKDNEPEILEIKIPEDPGHSRVKTLYAHIDHKGTLHAVSEMGFSRFLNVNFRKKYDQCENENDFIEKYIVHDLKNVEIDSFYIDLGDNLESEMKIYLRYNIDGFAEVSGNNMYFSSALLHKHTENIFKLENRTYPINFNYPISYEEKIVYSFPPGYEVIDLPTMTMPGFQGHNYEKKYVFNGNKLHYTRKFSVHKTYYSPSEYPQLKSYYGYMVQSDKDIITITKK